MKFHSDFIEIRMCFQCFLNFAKIQEQELVGVYSLMDYLT